MTAIVGLTALQKGLSVHRPGQPIAAVSAAWSDRLGRFRRRRPRDPRRAAGRRSHARWPPRAAPRPDVIDACRRRTGADRPPHPARHDLQRRPDDRRAGRRRVAPRRNAAADRRAAAAATWPSSPATEQLEHVIVVNVASTEPPVPMPRRCRRPGPELEPLLDAPEPCPLAGQFAVRDRRLGRGLLVYQLHALARAPPRRPSTSLARLRGTRHFGCDGKTGETLLKSVLAPMFARRNLQVMSWVGHNIFGNMDGRVLDDPANKQIQDRQQGSPARRDPRLPAANPVSIEFIDRPGRLEDRLGPRPLRRLPGHADDAAIHLAGMRFGAGRPAGPRPGAVTELARRRGHVGPMTFLASFFKSPYGVGEHRFDRQFQALEHWADAKE